ncbi:MAG TPA: nitrile hydratase subunit alpha [Steroidobacteraceae bacterium]|nr:nitrile hydratase subunit alpha [Steroidobacteraceae bacterium]
MTTTRRDLLTTALTAAGAAVTPRLAEGQAPDHDHDHDHGHDHGADHQAVPSDPALRAKALESVLVAKGLVDRAALDAVVDYYERQTGPRNGARVIARAWVDPAYKRRLLSNATAAIAELGYGGAEGEQMVVVENTPRVHNLVVCTLCSCYPWPVLGLPPVWYKSAAYRARSVIDPRGVLKEFGTELSGEVEVRVWDSTAEVRYLVLPERPAGSEALSEDELAALVTRDSMVGVARVSAPEARA